MNILDALSFRHAKDVFIPECNLGSAHAGCRRMDAWVLLKTWSPWTAIGYEIKTDRGDFLRDRKWIEYLPLCHEFYFVCPPKLIAPEELPQDAGLLWTTGGARLITKRRAVHRDVDPQKLSRLMSYVLMSRTRIVANMWEAQNTEEPREMWRRLLAEKDADRELGRLASARIRGLLRRAEDRARSAELERDRLLNVKEKLEAMGLNGNESSWSLERKLTRAPAMDEISRLAYQITRLAGTGG